MPLEGKSASIFDDLFEKAVDDVKDALTRNAELMRIEEPDSNAWTMLVLGALVSAYASALHATGKLAEKSEQPADYATAAAAVETFDQTVVPIIDGLRELIASGKAKGGEIAKVLALIESNADSFKLEERPV